MNIRASNFLIVFVAFLATFACTKRSTPDKDIRNNIPADVKNVKNLKVFTYSKKINESAKISLEKKQVFESSDGVFIEGYIGEIAIDDHNNAYVLSQKPGFVKIYVFGPDGSFKHKFLRSGRGPGEFEAIGSMSICNNKLYLLGSRLQKIGVFSIKNDSLVKEFSINKENLNNTDLTKTLRAKDLYVIDDSTLVISMESNLLSNQYQKKYLYKIDKTGKLFSIKLLDIKRHRIYETNRQKNAAGYTILPFTLPVNRSSIVAVSNNGNIYTNWTENFLIKVYNESGKYLHAFYYPYKKVPAYLSNLDIGEDQTTFLSGENVPNTWPVIRNMIVDDNNQIWVSTITKSDSTFSWFVLNSEGKIIATFDKSGEKKYNIPGLPPMVKIKNGYFYERERDISMDINRIVKYKIYFKKN